MSLVALITTTGVFQGELNLESAGGPPLRLLDALNHPGRVKQIVRRPVHGLELTRAMRRDLLGHALPCGELVAVRSDEVLAAYNVTVAGDGGSDAARARAYEERQQVRDPEELFFFLVNGFRLTGAVGGGVTVLDLAKPGRAFVPVYDAKLRLPGRETVLEIPLVVVNALRLEASGAGNPWAAPELG